MFSFPLLVISPVNVGLSFLLVSISATIKNDQFFAFLYGLYSSMF